MYLRLHVACDAPSDPEGRDSIGDGAGGDGAGGDGGDPDDGKRAPGPAHKTCKSPSKEEDCFGRCHLS